MRSVRAWAVGGVLVGALLVAGGWFLLIGPRYDEAHGLADQAATADQRLISLRHRLVELRKQSGKLPEYRAQLARDRQALPTVPALTDFLRELEAAGTASGTSVTGVVVGAATAVPGQPAYALPVTIVASGTLTQLDGFLDQVQQVQPRAVLVTSVNAVPDGQSASLAGTTSLTVSLQAFVAAPPGAEPAPTAD